MPLPDPGVGPALALLFCAGLIAAAATDLAWRRVPNALNAGFALTGAAALGLTHGWAGLADAALGVAAGFALVIAPFAMRLYRGGDAKLVMAIGAWMGPAGVVWAFLYGVVLGGVAGVAMLGLGGRALRREVGETVRAAVVTASVPRVDPERARARHVPMALAFGLGAVIAVYWRPL